MTCTYTLLLHYDKYKFYLAPKISLEVQEDNDLESLTDSGCATCGSAKDRTWKLKLHFLGNCSLASAWALFNQLQAFLQAGCEHGDLLIERSVCDEDPLVYQVTKAILRMTDVINQYTRQRVLTMELTLSLTAWVAEGEGAVLVG